LTAGDGESSVIGRPNRPSPSCSRKAAPFPSFPGTDGVSPSRPRPRSGRTVENTAQRLARVGIGLLSTQSLFPPLSRECFAGLSIGCSAGIDVPASGPPSCLRRRTTSVYRRLGVRSVLGTCPLAHVRTSVGKSWLPEASRCSWGWVSCFQLCLSACSHDVYCTCRPRTQPSPPSLLLRFVWSCFTCLYTRM
jgi:hypothetical protein